MKGAEADTLRKGRLGCNSLWLMTLCARIPPVLVVVLEPASGREFLTRLDGWVMIQE